jgi:hypothetical protein
MIARWANLKGADYSIFRATVAFLTGRLSERSTIDWALQLKPNDGAKRAALLDLIDGLGGNKVVEPWRLAWRLIEESWNSPTIENETSSRTLHISRKLKAGDRSGLLVSEIVDLVAPRLEVKPFSEWELHFRKRPKRPRSVDDLFSMGLTSGEVINPKTLGLPSIRDIEFLIALANGLDATVISGLDIGRRIGWDGKRNPWRLGILNRVYYVPKGSRPAGEHEPDEFHHGIAPSVKLLHFVVSHLVELDTVIAIEFADRWRRLDSPIHTRLFAALARDPRITSASDAAKFLLSLDDGYFWNQNVNPEVAELRATRFNDFARADQTTLISRLRRMPPRTQWPKKTEADQLKSSRTYWAVRELRRIEVAGGTLPATDRAWLSNRIELFPDLGELSRVDEGFMGTSKARLVGSNPDARYDLLIGEDRLKALETALSAARGGWDDDPAEQASSWIRQNANPLRIIADLEGAPDGGAPFPRVWERFGWSHSPAPEQGADPVQRDLPTEAGRVLKLLAKLSERTSREAIEGISHWLSTWEKHVVALPEGLRVWLKLWPTAVEATNANKPTTDETDLNTLVQDSGDREPSDLDTLNTPAGRFVGIFLAACPSMQSGDHPFQENSIQTQMRNAIENSIGPSGLIVKYRLIEALYYCVKADLDWTRKHLIPPLLEADSDALTLWRAVARRTRFLEELKLIGSAMADRALDLRLGRETRRALVFSLVVECLHAFYERRAPAIPYARIQQMIRSLEDELRANGAGAIQRFVFEVSAKGHDGALPPSPEELLRSAAKPFLQQVWPQEQSLTTPGVSRALADLPATVRSAFAEAVDIIERFLVPFECWSMLDYGLYGDEDGEPKLSNIDDPPRAAAFLRLLDRTIGDSDSSIVPMDLSDALDQIRKIAPNLVEGQMFRRLATAARRA